MKNLNRIMISYRREDSAGIAGRIYDRLVAQFGDGNVFKDVDSIPLGVDFERYLDTVISQCDVLLVVIGDRWISGKEGKNRLNDPRDFVRVEIQSALRRNIPIIPLLVQDTTMPSEDLLPSSIKRLAYRNGTDIRNDPHFNSDVNRLVTHLKTILQASETRPEEHVTTADQPIASHDASRVDSDGSTGQGNRGPNEKHVAPADHIPGYSQERAGRSNAVEHQVGVASRTTEQQAAEAGANTPEKPSEWGIFTILVVAVAAGGFGSTLLEVLLGLIAAIFDLGVEDNWTRRGIIWALVSLGSFISILSHGDAPASK